MKKRLTITIIVLLLIFGGTFTFDIVRAKLMKKIFANSEVPAVTVSTTIAKLTRLTPSIPAVGSMVAINSVNVNSRVPGQIMSINFESGQMVEKEQSLIQLDDSIDKQTLNNDLAQLKLTELTFKRYEKLLKSSSISQSDFDTAQANYVKAQSAVATDRLNIEYKNILAPFSGRIGIRQVNVGQYITPGESLVSLQSIDPMYVDFYIPEQELSKVFVDQEIMLSSDAFPGKSFTAKIIAINSTIDTDTRNILIRAVTPNPDTFLYPGLFVNIKIELPILKNVIVAPQTSINYTLYGDSLYVVVQKGVDKKGNPILVATQRYIKLGERFGNDVVVTEGLKTGEQIVATGQIKLQEGSRVTINNSISPN